MVSVIGRRAAPEADRTLPKVRHWTADLRDSAAVAAALDDIVRTHGKLTYIAFFQRFRGDGDQWHGEIQTSLTATKEVIEAAADHFDGSPENAIAIVGSVAGNFVAGEQLVGYHVAKAGLRQMARYYAVQLGPRGIRVNCVSPASVLKEESQDFYLKNPELLEFYKSIIPLGRIPAAEDVCHVIAFLCGPGAAAVTGQEIVVDGGISLHGQEALARRLSPFKGLQFTRMGQDKAK